MSPLIITHSGLKKPKEGRPAEESVWRGCPAEAATSSGCPPIFFPCFPLPTLTRKQNARKPLMYSRWVGFPRREEGWIWRDRWGHTQPSCLQLFNPQIQLFNSKPECAAYLKSNFCPNIPNIHQCYKIRQVLCALKNLSKFMV